MSSNDQYELAFPRVIEGIASGAPKREVVEWLGRVYPGLTPTDLTILLRDARTEAENQGVEREDIDDSWYHMNFPPRS